MQPRRQPCTRDTVEIQTIASQVKRLARRYQQGRDLLEVIDDRHGRGSTVLTSQIPVAHWHDLIVDPTIADAILDRLVHNSHRLELDGETLRDPRNKTAKRGKLDTTAAE